MRWRFERSGFQMGWESTMEGLGFRSGWKTVDGGGLEWEMAFDCLG